MNRTFERGLALLLLHVGVGAGLVPAAPRQIGAIYDIPLLGAAFDEHGARTEIALSAELHLIGVEGSPFESLDSDMNLPGAEDPTLPSEAILAIDFPAGHAIAEIWREDLPPALRSLVPDDRPLRLARQIRGYHLPEAGVSAFDLIGLRKQIAAGDIVPFQDVVVRDAGRHLAAGIRARQWVALYGWPVGLDAPGALLLDETIGADGLLRLSFPLHDSRDEEWCGIAPAMRSPQQFSLSMEHRLEFEHPDTGMRHEFHAGRHKTLPKLSNGKPGIQLPMLAPSSSDSAAAPVTE